LLLLLLLLDVCLISDWLLPLKKMQIEKMKKALIWQSPQQAISAAAA